MNFRPPSVMANLHISALKAGSRNEPQLSNAALPNTGSPIQDMTMQEVENFESDPELNFSWEAYEKSQRPAPTSSFRPSPVTYLTAPDCPVSNLRGWTSAARRSLACSVLSQPGYKDLPKGDRSWIPFVFGNSSPEFRQAVAEQLQPIPPVDDPETEEDNFPMWPTHQAQLARMTSGQVQDLCKRYDKRGHGSLAELLAFGAILAAAYDPHKTTQDKRTMLDELWHIVEDSGEPWPDPLNDCIAYLEMPQEELDASTRRLILSQKESKTISSACRYLCAINNDAGAAALEAEAVVAHTALPEECKWLDTAERKEEIPGWPDDQQRLAQMKPELVEAMCTIFVTRGKHELADWLAINASLAAAYAPDKTMQERTDMFDRLSTFLDESDETAWPDALIFFDAYIRLTESVEDQDVQARCKTLGATDPEAISNACRYLRDINDDAGATKMAAEALIGLVLDSRSGRDVLRKMWSKTKDYLSMQPWPENLALMQSECETRVSEAHTRRPR